MSCVESISSDMIGDSARCADDNSRWVLDIHSVVGAGTSYVDSNCLETAPHVTGDKGNTISLSVALAIESMSSASRERKLV